MTKPFMLLHKPPSLSLSNSVIPRLLSIFELRLCNGDNNSFSPRAGPEFCLMECSLAGVLCGLKKGEVCETPSTVPGL